MTETNNFHEITTADLPYDTDKTCVVVKIIYDIKRERDKMIYEKINKILND